MGQAMMMDTGKTMMMGSNMNMGMNTGIPAGQMNMMMIPRATMKMEKCADGMKIMCMASDDTAAAMMQNLCTMLAGGMTTMCMMMNGMVMMNVNMVMGMCKCEMTLKGMTMMWTSSEAMMCTMIQECCDCMMAMKECNCTMIMSMNNTPVCCC